MAGHGCKAATQAPQMYHIASLVTTASRVKCPPQPLPRLGLRRLSLPTAVTGGHRIALQPQADAQLHGNRTPAVARSADHRVGSAGPDTTRRAVTLSWEVTLAPPTTPSKDAQVKFIYVDESGGRDQSDVFTMCGLMVDAYKLRKKTEDFDGMLNGMFAGLPVQWPPRELKTKKFIEGGGPWKRIDAEERKQFLTDVCQLAVSNGAKVFGIALSFAAFDHAKGLGLGQPTQGNLWLASAMYTCCLLQKKMQGISGRKGLTVFIMDDNKREMPNLSDALYQRNPWYDGLYEQQKKKRGKQIWIGRSPHDRFDQIVNTAFAIKSDHSSLVQVADAISYVYRRHLELTCGQRSGQASKSSMPASSNASSRRGRNLVVASKDLATNSTRPRHIHSGSCDNGIPRGKVQCALTDPRRQASVRRPRFARIDMPSASRPTSRSGRRGTGSTGQPPRRSSP